MQFLNRIPRNARPFVLGIWMLLLLLILDQGAIFAIKAWKASRDVSSMESARNASFGLFIIAALMAYMVFRWCWHWSDQHDQQSRRKQLHVVRKGQGRSGHPA